MRRFVRLHPWRLEIVPAIAFAMSVAAYVMYRLRDNASVTPFGSKLDHDLTSMLFWPIVVVVCFWLMEFTTNHRWVMLEREKRFNWISVVMQVVILGRAAMSLQMSRWFVADPMHFEPTLRVFLGVWMAGASLAIVMEATRKFVPRPEDSEPELDGEQDSSSYTETEVDYAWAPMVLFFVASAVLALVYYRDCTTFGFGLTAAILIGSLSYRRVTVTREAVFFRWGPVGKRFAVSDISGCRAIRRQVFEWRRQRVKALAVTSGRCLEMTTRDGKVHMIGMLRPAHACGVLESLIAKERHHT